MKIMHISDLHFGCNQLNILPRFFEEVSSINPDFIIISGDLTQRAKSRQFKNLEDNFLSKLPADKIIVIPGNHDVPFYNVFLRMFFPHFNYNSVVGNKYKNYYTSKDLKILGLDSTDPFQTIGGKVHARDFGNIETFFEDSLHSVNILTLHHNIEKVPSLHNPIRNRTKFIEALKDSNINLVCTGHLHKAQCLKILKNNGKHCIVVHAGSLLSARTKDGFNSYFLIDIINNNNCEITLKVFENNSFVAKNKEMFEI